MGLFSRRERAPKPASNPQPSLPNSQSKSSLTSGSSSIVTPINTTNARIMNRTSAGTTSTAGGPGTPLTPFSPGPVPHIAMPRPPDPQLDPAGYLRSLGAVRERCKIVTQKALKNELNHFDVDMAKFPDVVSFVANIIKASLTPLRPPWCQANTILTARLRSPFHQHSPAWPVPAFRCWWTRQDCPSPGHLP
jgi:hypothetical protein